MQRRSDASIAAAPIGRYPYTRATRSLAPTAGHRAVVPEAHATPQTRHQVHRRYVQNLGTAPRSVSLNSVLSFTQFSTLSNDKSRVDSKARSSSPLFNCVSVSRTLSIAPQPESSWLSSTLNRFRYKRLALSKLKLSSATSRSSMSESAHNWTQAFRLPPCSRKASSGKRFSASDSRCKRSGSPSLEV